MAPNSAIEHGAPHHAANVSAWAEIIALLACKRRSSRCRPNEHCGKFSTLADGREKRLEDDGTFHAAGRHGMVS